MNNLTDRIINFVMDLLEPESDKVIKEVCNTLAGETQPITPISWE